MNANANHIVVELGAMDIDDAIAVTRYALSGSVLHPSALHGIATRYGELELTTSERKELCHFLEGLMKRRLAALEVKS